jgi:hypothetical protein
LWYPDSDKFTRGGDVHVGIDGNFHHSHAVSAGDSAPILEPTIFISKMEVDKTGERLIQARKTSRVGFQSRVPEAALDKCQKSYMAAQGDSDTTISIKFDDRGCVVMVCRHDIPIFMVNIDTPGEQHKYAVSLLLKLYAHLPPNATVTAFYDIGCAVDRSMNKVCLL